MFPAHAVFRSSFKIVEICCSHEFLCRSVSANLTAVSTQHLRAIRLQRRLQVLATGCQNQGFSSRQNLAAFGDIRPQKTQLIRRASQRNISSSRPVFSNRLLRLWCALKLFELSGWIGRGSVITCEMILGFALPQRKMHYVCSDQHFHQ